MQKSMTGGLVALAALLLSNSLALAVDTTATKSAGSEKRHDDLSRLDAPACFRRSAFRFFSLWLALVDVIEQRPNVCFLERAQNINKGNPQFLRRFGLRLQQLDDRQFRVCPVGAASRERCTARRCRGFRGGILPW